MLTCFFIFLSLSLQDSSRSQQILDSKGEDNGKQAPVLAPATIEGKAASDELIAVSFKGR